MKEPGVSILALALLAVTLLWAAQAVKNDPKISAVALSPPEEKKPSVRVEIGPNVRVGGNEIRQAEPYITAHPEDPRSLIISASEMVEAKGIIAQAYFTGDGGKTWSVAPLPRMREALLDNQLESALDNWVTYAPNGVAYYSSLWNPPREGTLIVVYRSEDQGHTWQGPIEISAWSFDQPRIVAAGKKGDLRLYIATSVNGSDALFFRHPIDMDVKHCPAPGQADLQKAHVHYA